jgi:hypothetical protein
VLSEDALGPAWRTGGAGANGRPRAITEITTLEGRTGEQCDRGEALLEQSIGDELTLASLCDPLGRPARIRAATPRDQRETDPHGDAPADPLRSIADDCSLTRNGLACGE